MTQTLPVAADPLGVQAAAAVAARVVRNVEQVVHGRREVVELVVCAVLAGGHVLVEDVPGSGKTTLARAVAATLGGTFRRVQGTSDLLPGDITGSGVWEPESRTFAFVPGPVFAHVVLADELNRTPPRTQSAFLEAMEEGAVTVDGVRHALPRPFLVLATQNPLEQHGTYPLPQAQLDRFAVALTLGANDPATERRVVREQLLGATVEALAAVTHPDELSAVADQVRRLHVAEPVLDHALRLVAATRDDPRVALGASTRAALVLVRVAQARALLHGRDHVLPDDVKAVAPPVLGHRLVLRGGRGSAAEGRALVAELLDATPVPLR